MEKFINELGKRRRHLAFLMMPPDASWPLISQMSRRHEYNDLTTRTSYHMFEGDLVILDLIQANPWILTLVIFRLSLSKKEIQQILKLIFEICYFSVHQWMNLDNWQCL